MYLLPQAYQKLQVVLAKHLDQQYRLGLTFDKSRHVASGCVHYGFGKNRFVQ